MVTCVSHWNSWHFHILISQCPIQCFWCLFTPEEGNLSISTWTILKVPIRQRKVRHEEQRRERESCKSYRKHYSEMECALFSLAPLTSSRAPTRVKKWDFNNEFKFQHSDLAQQISIVGQISATFVSCKLRRISAQLANFEANNQIKLD